MKHDSRQEMKGGKINYSESADSFSQKTVGRIKAFLFHKYTRTIVKIVIPFIILFYLFSSLNLSLIKHNMLSTNIPIFAISFIFLCARNVVGAYRSKALLMYKGFPYSLAILTKYYFIGNFFNLFLPAVVGRDIARGYYLYTSSSGKKETISSIVVERFIGTSALVILSLFSVFLAFILGLEIFDNTVIKSITIIFGVSVVFFSLFFNRKTHDIVETIIPSFARKKLDPAVKFIQDIFSYNRAPGILFSTLISSILFQIIGVLSTYLIAVSLGSVQPCLYFFILLPVIWLAGLLPVSINGLGIREGSFVFLFRSTGMSEEMAMTIGLLWSIQTIGLGLIGGLLFTLGKKNNLKVIQSN
ncbi:MAG: flippase-like domain-containing protein [Candidatus Latescibacteria bacterium]|nr:flippase-like domain-containing protein [Candidatus Latescibacterota bacterium]